MKYLKKFETHSQYQSYIEGDTAVLPNVSYCENIDEVHYNPYDYSRDYFTFEVLESGYISFTNKNLNLPNVVFQEFPITIEYSTNNGDTWQEFTSSTSSELSKLGYFSAGDKIWVRGNNNYYAQVSTNSYNCFGGTAKTKVYGNIMSLIYKDGFEGRKELTGGYNFSHLFCNYTKLVDSSGLVLTIDNLTPYCFSSMYLGCSNLIKIPSIKIKAAADHSCFEMFKNCTSLQEAPIVLSALTLDEYCYDSMFEGCTELIIPPELPMTTGLRSYCYCDMFDGCSKLETAPKLPAITLAPHCYSYMFLNCSLLKHIECLAIDISAEDSLFRWTTGVNSQDGIFVKNSAATWNVRGESGVPTRWTIQYVSE